MFHHISKHLEFRQKYSSVHCIFNDETMSLAFDILHDNFLPGVVFDAVPVPTPDLKFQFTGVPYGPLCQVKTNYNL